MAILVCFICVYNDKVHPENHAVAYADCDHCAKPTCKKHGCDLGADRFFCIRCARVLQFAR